MRAMDCGSRTGARSVLPLTDVGVREADMLAWWKEQPFDLGIPSWAGNGTLCFLKGRRKLLRSVRDDPALADWWIEQEAKVARRTGPDGRACASRKRWPSATCSTRPSPATSPKTSTATAPTDSPGPPDHPAPPGGGAGRRSGHAQGRPEGPPRAATPHPWRIA